MRDRKAVFNAAGKERSEDFPRPLAVSRPQLFSPHGGNLDELLQDLTDAQREAVLHLEGPLLILAGPGSGKTRVVTHRIARLLAEGVPDQQILALTFTNKAAEEMRSRVERLAPGCSVWVSTFHRFCARLLRKYASFVGLQQNYTVYDAGDSRAGPPPRHGGDETRRRLDHPGGGRPGPSVGPRTTSSRPRSISRGPAIPWEPSCSRFIRPTRPSWPPPTRPISTTCSCTWPCCCGRIRKSAAPRRALPLHPRG